MLLLYVLALAAFFASGFLNTVPIEQQSYQNVASAVSRIGWWIMISAAAGLAAFVTQDSLVQGTATLGERMMVLGVITCFVSFSAIWIGIGLLLMKDSRLAVLIPVLPGLFVYHNLHVATEVARRAIVISVLLIAALAGRRSNATRHHDRKRFGSASGRPYHERQKPVVSTECRSINSTLKT